MKGTVEMKKNLRIYNQVLFALFILSFIGCNWNEGEQPDITGIYRGTYTIIQNFGTDSSLTNQDSIIFTFGQYITLSFLRNKGNKVFDNIEYYYIGDKPFLPPTGGGKYSNNGGKIILNDSIMHIALFDWSLILQGQFDYSFDGKNLIMVQNDLQYKRFHKLILSKQD